MPIEASNQITVVNFFNDKDSQTAEIEATSKSLRECGYDVQIIKAKTAAAAINQLKTRQLESGGIVFIDSHGNLRDRVTKDWFHNDVRRGVPGVGTNRSVNELMFTDTEEGKGKVIGEAETFLAEVNQLAPNLRMWVDACHGGACLKQTPPTMCIGATCGIMEKAPSGPRMRKIFVGLLCDAKAGCKKWKKTDQNGDGKIDARELDLHLKTPVGHETVKSSEIVSKEGLKDLERLVREKEGRIISTEPVGSPLQIRYTKVEIHNAVPPQQKTSSLTTLAELTDTKSQILFRSISNDGGSEYLAKDKKTAELDLRKIFPNWPICGQYGGTKLSFRLENCSIEVGREEYFEVGYEYIQANGGSSTEPTFRPLPNTFSLIARQCAKSSDIPRLSPPSPVGH